jgi:hypothetical protein
MIPSLLQIPSAVSDSKLHSVLPNNGKGDFTFDRSTGATRINKDGLIEEVGYFSSELVQNGNFSELGSEELTNGDFATDSAWSKGTGWVIMNGYAESDGTNAPLDQVYPFTALTIGKTYKVVITVTNMTASALSVRLGTSSSTAILSITENGTYTAYGVAGAATFRLRSQGFNGRIQNVSVKQVDPNDKWTLASNWSYATNKITSDGSQTGNVSLTQANSIMGTVTGKVYQVKFTISDYSAGTINAHIQGQGSTNVTGNGEKKVIVTASSASYGINMYADSNFAGSVSNISVVEVQGDRPRLSYDITNGVVEDKPHLLLEPSATNLFTFSEDFSQSVWTKASVSITSNSIISPDGTQNASTMTITGGTSDQRIHTNITFSGTNTVSVFAKAKDSKFLSIRVDSLANKWYDLENGTLGGSTITTNLVNSSIDNFGNGWYRCSMTFTNSASTNVRIYPAEGNQDVTHTSGSVYIWGAMAESSQSYATSYIPTAGTTITRAAETCNNSKPSVNSTEGVLYAELFSVDEPTSKFIAISDGTDDNRIAIYYHSSNNNITTQVRASNSEQFSRETSGISREQFNKIAVLYKANEFKMYVNGNQIGTTDTSGSVPSGLNTIAFDEGDGTSVFYGKVKGLAVYNEALSESQLMQLTGVTASSIYNNFVTRTASFTVEALNEVKKVIDNL